MHACMHAYIHTYHTHTCTYLYIDIQKTCILSKSHPEENIPGTWSKPCRTDTPLPGCWRLVATRKDRQGARGGATGASYRGLCGQSLSGPYQGRLGSIGASWGGSLGIWASHNGKRVGLGVGGLPSFEGLCRVLSYPQSTMVAATIPLYAEIFQQKYDTTPPTSCILFLRSKCSSRRFLGFPPMPCRRWFSK